MRRQTTALVMAGVTAAAVMTGATVSNAASGPSAAAHHPTASSAAAAAKTISLRLRPSSPELAACFPHAKSTRHRRPDHRRRRQGQVPHRGASGLKPRTAFTVFLIEKAGAPFGAVEYIGDFTTDRYGQGAPTPSA